MIDQTQLDLRQVIGGDLRRVAGTNGGEFAGSCPFCGGRDRFRVWPNQGRWWCRQCERHGDAVGFVQQHDGVRFTEAVRMLGLDGQARTYQPGRAPPAQAPESSEPPPDKWQWGAGAFVERCITHLHGEYQKPRKWLHSRGFTDATIAAARLGYHPADAWVSRLAWGLAPTPQRTRLWLPRGIVIPWFVDGVLWKVFLRRPIPPDAWEVVRQPPDAPEPTGLAAQVWQCLREQRSFVTVATLTQHCDVSADAVRDALDELHATHRVQRPTKHYQVPGGRNGIYNADTIRAGQPVVLVEAALDALAIQQAAGDLCAAVATGTTGGRAMRWIGRVARASRVLLAYDNDQGGDTPTAFWRSVLGAQAHIWRPYWDDPAGMLARGLDVRGWVATGLLTADPPDEDTLEARLLAAAEAGDWSVAEALAARHLDADGVRLFLAAARALA